MASTLEVSLVQIPLEEKFYKERAYKKYILPSRSFKYHPLYGFWIVMTGLDIQISKMNEFDPEKT